MNWRNHCLINCTSILTFKECTFNFHRLLAVADPGLERSLGQVYPRIGYLPCSCHGKRICMQTNTCHARTDSCSYSGTVPLADGSPGTCPRSPGPGSAPGCWVLNGFYTNMFQFAQSKLTSMFPIWVYWPRIGRLDWFVWVKHDLHDGFRGGQPLGDWHTLVKLMAGLEYVYLLFLDDWC